MSSEGSAGECNNNNNGKLELVKFMECTNNKDAVVLNNADSNTDIVGTVHEQDFIRSVTYEQEEAHPGTRNKFWCLGPIHEEVMEKTRSTLLQLKANDVHVYKSKTMLDIMCGRVRVTYAPLLPLTGKNVKIFRKKDGLILIEASKDRPIEISLGKGIKAMCLPMSAIPQHVEPGENARLDPAALKAAGAGGPASMALVRVGWLREEYSN